MGLMFSRRRAEAQKQIEANKAKAHAANQKKALEDHKAAQAPSKAVKDGSDKSGAK